MRQRAFLVLLLVAALLVAASPALAAADTAAALDYLKAQQNPDGGFGNGFTPGSSVGSTADVVLAVLAAGADPATFAQNGNTPLTYLAANAPSATTAGDIAKLIQAAVAAGENPRQFGGTDSVAALEAMLGPDGKYGGANETFVGHALAVLALTSASRPIPAPAIEYIKKAQQADGGWAWDGTTATPADTNSTAFAVQALVAAGEPADGAIIAAAMSYYKAIQNDDGGWPYQNPSQYGTATDANSTAVSIQALLAAGQDPAGADWTTGGGATPPAALEALQNDSGAFAWQATMPDDNLLATIQALPAVSGKVFPLATMDVGEAAAPATMPETGGGAAGPALALLLSGLALAGGGYALRRR